MDQDQQTNSTPWSTFVLKYKTAWLVTSAIVLLSIFFSLYYFFISPPADFPQGMVVTVASGENLKSVVNDFRSRHIIRSSSVFQSLVILFGGENKVIAGDYLLKNSVNAITLASQIVRGDFGMVEVKVTIPEGFTVADIAVTLERKLVQFNDAQFLSDAKGKEGYLFPDTYFFPPTATSSDIVSRMQANFQAKMTPFATDIIASGHSQSDIIKMASIVEGEATSTHDRQIVAGILWKRLKLGMALQVDSSLKYITGRSSAELTVSDLHIDSLYNTYLYRGLPPTPINNPGTDSISATLHPVTTQYLYFLTGTDGVMHYAKTFAEHVSNEKKYLK